jgi:transaldolase
MVNRDIGYSLWLDFIERDFLKTKFSQLVEKGIINGATSNPAIFSNAIMTSPAYKEQLDTLKDKAPKEKYEALAIADIKLAAQLLRPLYDIGNDGYISLEVDPMLANDTKATVAEAKRLFKAVGEPNVMMKVPATKAGYSAMRQLLATGISVNATLIFSLSQARKCLKAMKKGLAVFESSGGRRAEGVISVFVSRFDRELDEKLNTMGISGTLTGIYNAARIYRVIEKSGVPNVRALFASTGVKEPSDLPKDYYIRELYGRHCINTAPLATIEEYIKTPQETETLPLGIKVTKPYFEMLKDKGIDMNEVYDKLLHEGLVAFEESFAKMLDSLQ